MHILIVRVEGRQHTRVLHFSLGEAVPTWRRVMQSPRRREEAELECATWRRRHDNIVSVGWPMGSRRQRDLLSSGILDEGNAALSRKVCRYCLTVIRVAANHPEPIPIHPGLPTRQRARYYLANLVRLRTESRKWTRMHKKPLGATRSLGMNPVQGEGPGWGPKNPPSEDRGSGEAARPQADVQI